MILVTVFVVLVLIVILGLFIVEQQSLIIIERLGKFLRVAGPGLNWRIPLIDRLAHEASLRIQEQEIEVQSITLDKVPVQVDVSLQFKVVQERVSQAFYQLDDPEGQMSSYVFNVVRSTVPNMTLDELFSKQDEVQDRIKHTLREVMDDYGYEIIAAPITDIDPVESVKIAMAKINEEERLAEAAKKEAERKVTLAEADGKGIAAQRKAIVMGFKESIEDFQTAVPSVKPEGIMDMVLMVQYFDALKEIGGNNKSSTIFIPHSPGAVGGLMDQLRNTFISAGVVKTEGES